MVAYIVNFTDPEVTPFNVNSFTTDGPAAPNTLQLNSTAVKASTSLLLYGKGHAEYGERIQENLVNLMENFSGATEPTFPISGQTWFSRVTYVMIEYGTGSPLIAGLSARIFRWSDSAGGSWTELENVEAVDPVTATPPQVKTGGAQPTPPIVDGSFWLDAVGSPLVPELYLAVNSASSNLSATFLKREMENLTGLITAAELTSGEYQPQKQLKVYDGAGWKNSGNVFTSKAAPQNPAIGDLWYQLSIIGSPPIGSPLSGGGDPLSQLFIWARPRLGTSPRWLPTGYVDRTGDVMTGTLSFGLPTSSLFIWEGKGISANGADLRMTGDGLLTSAENFYIHIDYDNSDTGAGNVVFEIATGSQDRGSPQNPLFQVQNDGVIRSALVGSPEGSTYETLIAADKNALTNRAYVDNITGATSAIVTSNTARILVNETNIGILNSGSPVGSPINVEAKVSRIGDTMTGQLIFVGSPAINFDAIDVTRHRIINLPLPTAADDAASKIYVDDAIELIADVLGSPMVDNFVDGTSFDQDTMTLTLTRSGDIDLTRDISHNHLATALDHIVATPFLRDTFQESEFGSPLGSPIDVAGSPPKIRTLSVTQSQINDTAIEVLNTRTATLEAPTDREVFVATGSPLGTGSPASFSLTEETYEAGLNRLQIYVNGVKQYANERAYQKIVFNLGTVFQGGISPSARTFLPFNSTFTIDIAVDGGGSQVASALGKALQLYQDIIDLINSDITGATAVWSERDTAIVVYSDTTGIGSAIDIADGGGSPLTSILFALSNECTGSPLPTGSPLLNCHYTVGNISPVAGGAVSTIVLDLAYREVVDYTASTVDATFGQTASSVIFNTSLNPGDVIELLAFPA